MFNPDEAKYANGILVELPYPTNDVRLLTKAVIQAVDHIYRPGFKYNKAEVLLMDFRQPGEYTDDLFAEVQPVLSNKLMNPGRNQWPLGPCHPAHGQRADQA